MGGWGHPTPTPRLRDQTCFVVFDLFSSAPVSTFLSVRVGALDFCGSFTSVEVRWN